MELEWLLTEIEVGGSCYGRKENYILSREVFPTLGSWLYSHLLFKHRSFTQPPSHHSSSQIFFQASSKRGFHRGNTRLITMAINFSRKSYTKGERPMPPRLSDAPGGRVLNGRQARCEILSKSSEKVGHEVETIIFFTKAKPELSV